MTEIVDDLYLAPLRPASATTRRCTTRDALQLAREVVDDPHDRAAAARPASPTRAAAVRVDFAKDVLAELERRKRRLGVLGYDDLLTRLADALEADDSPARARMRQRWPIVHGRRVPGHRPGAVAGHRPRVQRARHGGPDRRPEAGDLRVPRRRHRHLPARRRETAATQQTLATNWRSDAALRRRGCRWCCAAPQLGDPRSWCDDVEAHHRGHRLAGAPHNDPFRLRVVQRPTFGPQRYSEPRRSTSCASTSARDLAADIRALLASGATFDGEPLQARDIAVIVETAQRRAGLLPARCATRGIPAVVHRRLRRVRLARRPTTGCACWRRSTSRTAPGWCAPPRRRCSSARPRETLAAGGDALTDRIADTLREWAAHARERGVAAIFEAAQLRGHGRSGAVLAGRRAAHDRPGARRRSCCRTSRTASGSGCPRCATGCASSATSAAAQPNATAGWTATPPPCRS